MVDVSFVLRIIWGVLNFLQILVGLLFFAYAIKVLVQTNRPLSQLASVKQQMHWELIILLVCSALGGLILTNGVMGICVLCEQSSTLTKIYAGVMVVFILGLTAGVVFTHLYKKRIISLFETKFNKSIIEEFNGYFSADRNSFTKEFTSIMILLKCCGVEGPADFKRATKPWNKNISTPAGCCKYKSSFVIKVGKKDTINDFKKKLVNPECFTKNSLTNADIVYQIGCVKRVVQIDSQIPLGTTGVGLVIILFLIISLIIHILLGQKKEEAEEMEQEAPLPPEEPKFDDIA